MTSRIFYFDFIRALAIVSVIFMHSLSPYLRDMDSSLWSSVNFLDSIVRYSVPLFVMISGALLLSKNELVIKVFIKKSFFRIVLPTIVWSLVYLYLYKNLTFSFETINMILKGPVYYHLWFMYMLISIYIAYPLLWGYIQKANKYNLIYILVAWFVIVSLLPALSKFYHISVGIRTEVLTNYMGYFMLGYFLSTYNFTFKYSKIVYGTMSIILVILTAYGTEVLSHTKLNLYFYGNVSPNVILMSIFVYLFIKEIDFSNLEKYNNFIYSVISNISTASLGIYLLHPIILKFIRSTKYFIALDDFTFFQIFISGVGTVGFSFLIIYILQKTPLKRVV